MRLLNVYSLQLQEFAEHEQPPYVITSHRWGDAEATYKDVRKERNKDSAGFRKIQAFCKFTKNYLVKPGHGTIEWIWIDTCCIDKSSSAELTEAINSMFRWYAEAEVCLAFLQDVKHERGANDAEPWGPLYLTLEQSVWFTRGWTLQELLAPAVVLFVDAAWSILGHKGVGDPPSLYASRSWNLNTLISGITGVSIKVLEDFANARDVSLEDKQRWMQTRRTTRVEDMAYCQLGIFGVFMPLIYGERDQAMERLSEAVKKRYGEGLRDAASLTIEPKGSGGTAGRAFAKAASDHANFRIDAIAQWDYEAREDNEIDFKEGDRITEIEKVDEDWWMGRNEKGIKGLFPGNHVEIVHSRDPAPSDLRTNTVKAEQPPAKIKDAEVSITEDDNSTQEQIRRTADDNEIKSDKAYQNREESAKTDGSQDSTRRSKGVRVGIGEYMATSAVEYDTATREKPGPGPIQRQASSLQSQDEQQTVIKKSSLSPALQRVATIQARAEEEARIRRENQPKPFKWLNGLFSRDENKSDSKTSVSTRPSAEQTGVDRTERQAAKSTTSSEREQSVSDAPSLTRRSTTESKASSTKTRPSRKGRRATREATKRWAVAPGFESTGTSAQALHGYIADETNEIDLTEGEIISDIEKVDGGWWMGTNTIGYRGLFPSNYVEEIKIRDGGDEQRSKALPPARSPPDPSTSRQTAGKLPPGTPPVDRQDASDGVTDQSATSSGTSANLGRTTSTPSVHTSPSTDDSKHQATFRTSAVQMA